MDPNMNIFLVFSFLSVTTGAYTIIPEPVKHWANTQLSDISQSDHYKSETSLQTEDANMFGFKHVFVDGAGRISHTKSISDTQIKISGSPGVAYKTLDIAASIVARITRYMPANIFTNMAASTYIGVFSKAETLTVFPEFKMFANGNCSARCDGVCAHTCYLPGKKFEDMAGLSREISVVLEDNVLCSIDDPMQQQSSVLVHEFAHATYRFGLTLNTTKQVKDAYESAKRAQIWNVNSSDMTNELEYFASGATVFFSVDQKATMNICGNNACITEEAQRNHLKSVDPALFHILAYVFTNGRPNTSSDLTICPAEPTFVE